MKSKVKWVIEECYFLLISKAASTCGLIEERNEERIMKASEKESQFGLWDGGYGREPKAHHRADLEQKCITGVCNLSSAHILYSFTCKLYQLSWKTRMRTVSLKCSQGQLEEAPAFPLPLQSLGFLWHPEVCRPRGITVGQSQARIPRSTALNCCSDRPAAWPISVFIRDFTAFYASFISWLDALRASL